MGVAVRVLAGFAVALMCTPAGVSGAFLLLPVQVLLFGAPSPAVSATNLLYNVVSTPAGALAFRRRETLDRSLTARLVIGTVPGVVLGVLARSTVLADADTFAPVAAAVLVVLGLRLLVERGSADGGAPRSIPGLRLFLVGLAAGVVGGVYGLGGAALVVPWLVSVEKLPLRVAAPPGLIVTLVTSVLGLAAFVVADLVGLGDASGPEWANGLALGIGGAAGAVVGVRLQPRLPVRLLRTVLALAALTAGVRLLLS
jgi:uncharacterized membrane protein YfcA